MQPFNAGYIWQNTSANEIIPDPTISHQNSYIGGITQQATSVVTNTDQNCYEGTLGCYSIYGFEYAPGFDTAVRCASSVSSLTGVQDTDLVVLHIVYHVDIEQHGVVDVECGGDGGRSSCADIRQACFAGAHGMFPSYLLSFTYVSDTVHPGSTSS